MFSTSETILLIIDVQGKLAYLMHEKDEILKNLQGLIQAAQILDIPIIFTEQVPVKIGKTIPEISQYFRETVPIIKATFSCCGENKFLKKLKMLKRKQIIVAGIETHVCVYQTVADLIKMKYEVQVVADSVSSRTEENKILALDRMKSKGATLTSTEMIMTELLKTSQHPRFKEILNLIR